MRKLSIKKTISVSILFMCFIAFCMTQNIIADKHKHFKRGILVSSNFRDERFGRFSDVLQDKSTRDEFIKFCNAPFNNKNSKIDYIYYWSGWYGVHRISESDEKLKTFIKDVHEAGMDIYIFAGSKEFLYDNKEDIWKKIDTILAFNRESELSERFDGIMLDIEPHTLGYAMGDHLDWKNDKKKIWARYLRFLDYASEKVKKYNLESNSKIELGESIPAFYTGEKEGDSFWDADFKEIISRVDRINLMQPFDNYNAIVQASSEEINAVAEMKKKICLTFFTCPPDSDLSLENTFWDEDLGYIENAITQLEENYMNDPSVEGIHFFVYETYKSINN